MSEPMKSDWIKLRLSPDEKATFEQAAAVAGASLSSWVRERLRKSAAAELEAAGLQIPFIQALRHGGQHGIR
ncbi:MAG TPA: DUF1778 domain-containing protein [Thermoanaerobaculia bacterium]|jgi:uncharacterized protein (DUF1778 family)|nr:DUF1778 domain-containing protein [Thermoanaerobaculia bacterium]